MGVYGETAEPLSGIPESIHAGGERIYSGDETSFTIIAFPVPAIGEHFPEIFKETIRINTLDYELYRNMQQKIIDVLDTAEYVEVIGKGENRTNMQVRLAALSDPE